MFKSSCLLLPNPGIVVTDKRAVIYFQTNSNVYLMHHLGKRIPQEKGKIEQIKHEIINFSGVSHLFSMFLTFPLCFGDRTESQVHRSSLNPSLNTQQVHGSACLSRSHSDCMKSSTAVAFIHKTQPAFYLVLFFISYFLAPLLSFKDIFRRVKRPLFLSTTESGPHLPDTPEIQ